MSFHDDLEAQRKRGIARSIASKKKKWQMLSDHGSLFCEQCGEPYTTRASLITHHKTRLADGGTNDLDNLEMLCQNCHKSAHPKGFRWG